MARTHYVGVEGYRIAQRYYGDKGCCAVVAVAVAAGVGIGKAYHALKRHGRPHGKGTPFDAIWNGLRDLGYKVRRDHSWRTCTVSTVASRLPSKGYFLCYTRGHIFTVRDGEVVDWTEGRRHRVKMVWEVIDA